MSSKKTKKHHSAKYRKQLHLEQDNKFRNSLYRIAELAGSLDAFLQLPEVDRRVMVNIRFREPKLVLDHEFTFPPWFYKTVHTLFYSHIDKDEICLFENGPKVSIREYLTTVQTL
jgi:hypothetical protein